MSKDQIFEEEGDFDADGDRKFVTALARGLEVLRCFRPFETTLTNQEISARTGLPKPTVSRLTHTLCKLDYLIYSERTGTYRLGAGVLALGFGVLSGMEMADRAAEELRALCDGPNAHITAALGERHRLSVVYTAVSRSHQAVTLTINVGARLPLFFSAIGRAILIGLGPEERAHLVQLAKQEKPHLAGKIDEALQLGLDDYAKYGFCTSFGDWRPEVNGIAVPVVSLNGDRIYGLNVGGPSFLISPEELLKEYGDRLKQAARNLSSGQAPLVGAS